MKKYQDLFFFNLVEKNLSIIRSSTPSLVWLLFLDRHARIFGNCLQDGAHKSLLTDFFQCARVSHCEAQWCPLKSTTKIFSNMDSSSILFLYLTILLTKTR